MEEIIKMMPLFLLCVIIFFVTSYWLKDNNKLNNQKLNFDYYVNTKIRYAKLFSIFILGVMVIKIIYILLTH